MFFFWKNAISGPDKSKHPTSVRLMMRKMRKGFTLASMAKNTIIYIMGNKSQVHHGYAFQTCRLCIAGKLMDANKQHNQIHIQLWSSGLRIAHCSCGFPSASNHKKEVSLHALCSSARKCFLLSCCLCKFGSGLGVGRDRGSFLFFLSLSLKCIRIEHHGSMPD